MSSRWPWTGWLGLLVLSLASGCLSGSGAELADLTIVPAEVVVRPGTQQQFHAELPGGTRVGAWWSIAEAGGGHIDEKGRYTAPTAEGDFTIVATEIRPPHRQARARVKVVREAVQVVVEPATCTVSVGGSIQLHATVTGTEERAVRWSIPEGSAGTVTEDGLYTAPDVPGRWVVRAESVADPEAYAEAQVEVVEGVAVTIFPRSASLAFGERQQFNATVTGTDDRRVVWSVEESFGGTIDDEGVYTAPSIAGTFRVVAVSVADPTRGDSVLVTVREPVSVEVEPSQARLSPGATMQFVASVRGSPDPRVRWRVLEPEGGTVDEEGRYTAPDRTGNFTLRAEHQADPSTFGEARIEVVAGVAVTVTPQNAVLRMGEQQRFVAVVTGSDDRSVEWSVREADGGTIDPDGNYQSPLREGTFTVVATSRADPGAAGEARVTVRPRVTVTIEPSEARVQAGDGVDFSARVEGTADGRIAWTVLDPNGGRIDDSGHYTAPETPGTCFVRATSLADPQAWADARVEVVEPIAVAVSPESAVIRAGERVLFTAVVSGSDDGRVTWSVLEEGGGTIDAEGWYTAPAAPGLYTVVATSVADPRRSDRAEVQVLPQVVVSVEPATVTLEFGETIEFVATVEGTEDRRVSWSVSPPGGGGIDESGRYTAPETAGTFSVRATSLADPSRSASATVTVRPPVSVRVEPREVTVAPGEEVAFVAHVTGSDQTGVTWSVLEPDGGTIDASGRWRAPDREGTFRIRATSVADPRRSDTATAVVALPLPIDLEILPPDRRTVWNPGIPGGIPRERQVFAVLDHLTADGTGDNGASIQAAIEAAGAEYQRTGVIQEVVLPAGTFRTTQTIALNRSGVVLRGQGMDRTKLRYDGTSASLRIGRNRFTTYTAAHGPWYLAADAPKGSRQIVLANADATLIEEGDILCIDEEDDPSFVRVGDARFEKRQPVVDTHGPALRQPGRWRSVTSMIQVVGKSVGETETTLTLADPLHMSFRTGQYAQVWQIATEYSSRRSAYDGVHWNGIENLYVTGGWIETNNVAFCWIDGVEVDGNPGTPNVGTYSNPGGISGRSVSLFHAYRCELRNSFIHHTRNISQGGAAYLVSISSYTSESLIENNIITWGNKLIVGNMMGGGNVIAYNYVDNARTYHSTWQEGAIDLNHQSFTHNALVEGNWSANLTSDTTHGNAGWHVFFRNFATGQNSNPLYGPYPYQSAPDGAFRRAVGIDGYHREATFIGNVLLAGTGTPVYQVDHTTGAMMGAAAVWRIGWGTDGYGDRSDDGTALSLLHRHGNWDLATGSVNWESSNPVREIPPSLYLRSKPAFFGEEAWPWVDPLGASEAERVRVLPAKARFDALMGND